MISSALDVGSFVASEGEGAAVGESAAEGEYPFHVISFHFNLLLHDYHSANLEYTT